MKVWIKEPGKRSVIKDIENDLRTLQEIVGGYIECVNVNPRTVLICDEEGKLKGKLVNFAFCGDLIVGTAIICGLKDEEFTDVPYTLDEVDSILENCADGF